jgi:hypothetical protein
MGMKLWHQIYKKNSKLIPRGLPRGSSFRSGKTETPEENYGRTHGCASTGYFNKCEKYLYSSAGDNHIAILKEYKRG